MATNQTGIAIVIKAWLPTGKTLDEQLAALTLVKTAHETSDYAPLLAAAQIEAVQTDSKTRRVDAQTAEERAVEMANDVQGIAENSPLVDMLTQPEPAATDDAMAERASPIEDDGTVTEPAVVPAKGKPAKREAAAA